MPRTPKKKQSDGLDLPALPQPVDDALAAVVNEAVAAEAVAAEAVAASPAGEKKRNRKLPLTAFEALEYADRGIYVDVGETGQLRCSCNHKPCDKWDAYGYTRHFTFKCHTKYEEERLDESESARLRDAKETYLRINPMVSEGEAFLARSRRGAKRKRSGEKLLSTSELRVQEAHWMAMWKDSRNELRQLREDLKSEDDEEVRAELLADIEGLKKRKGDWAKLLGLNEASTEEVTTSI